MLLERATLENRQRMYFRVLENSPFTTSARAYPCALVSQHVCSPFSATETVDENNAAFTWDESLVWSEKTFVTFSYLDEIDEKPMVNVPFDARVGLSTQCNLERHNPQSL